MNNVERIRYNGIPLKFPLQKLEIVFYLRII